jgi:hypothetical protein
MAGVTEQGTFTPDNLIGGDKKLVTEDVLVASGQNLVRGSVLGRVKVSVPTTGSLAGTGNGTCTAVTGGPKTKQGTYTIACVVVPVTHGGTFRVTNPDGQDIGFFTMPDTAGGTYAFKSDEINFTLTDGATNFDLTSVFTIAVTEGVPDSAAVTGTGNGTCTEIEGRRALKVGNYVVTCTAAGTTHGGTFGVVDPDGKTIGTLVLPDTAGGSATFTHDQITFKITDGSTNFAVDDYFTITVSIAPRQVKLLDKTATDGSSAPYAVLSEAVDATSAAKMAIAYLEGQFDERQLVFASGTDIEDVRDAMRDLGMIAVPSVAAGSL